MDEVVPRDDRHPETVGLPAVILGHEGELVAARLALLKKQNAIGTGWSICSDIWVALTEVWDVPPLCLGRG